jgi:hypothetical protein
MQQGLSRRSSVLVWRSADDINRERRFPSPEPGQSVIKFRQSVAALSLLALVALTLDCAGSRRRTKDQDDVAGADSALTHFLSLSIATRSGHLRILDSVWVTDSVPGSWERGYWLADWRILSTILHADSGQGTVAITTSVFEGEDEAATSRDMGLVGTIGVREDTAVWRLVRAPGSSNGWKVLGDGEWLRRSRDSMYGVVHLDVVPIQLWRPAGATSETARRAVDSLRQARGLRVVR